MRGATPCFEMAKAERQHKPNAKRLDQSQPFTIKKGQSK